jgi:hypothetical protein
MRAASKLVSSFSCSHVWPDVLRPAQRTSTCGLPLLAAVEHQELEQFLHAARPGHW